MSKKTIWDELKRRGFSDTAAAALIGNMEAESNCISYRVQGDFTKGFQRSIEYTAQVDAANISRHEFIYDGPGGGGYGLMQWTYQPRKAGLYDLTEKNNVSIGDEAMQIDWLCQELKQAEFYTVFETLKKSASIRECSDVLIKKYLMPDDQSEAVCKYRANLGREFLQEFQNAEAEDPDGIPEDDKKIDITEEELKTFSKAMLVVKTLQDLLKMVNDF